MSKTSKIVLGVVIIIVVIAAIIWLAMAQNSAANGGQGAPVSQNASSSTGSLNDLTTAPTDSSDEALNQDLSSVDAQMKGLSSDAANVNQGQ